MINHSRKLFHKSHVRYMCTPRRLPNLKSWPGVTSRQTIKPNTVSTCTTTAVKYNSSSNTKNDKIYTDKWMEGFLPEGKSEK